MPRGYVHHYDINIQPDKCPRKVNREIIETMVHAYTKIFGTLKPVFDGRNNLYTRDPLPIGTDKLELEVFIFWQISIIYVDFYSPKSIFTRSYYLEKAKIEYLEW